MPKRIIVILNDLIEINNDRVKGYLKAAEETYNDDLRTLFYNMADESNRCISELVNRVVKLGGEPATGTTKRGKLYRLWMDIKASFTGNDSKSILESCEFGEDVAQRAYQHALESDIKMEPATRQLLAIQRAFLKIGHNLIKRYRDSYSRDNIVAIHLAEN